VHELPVYSFIPSEIYVSVDYFFSFRLREERLVDPLFRRTLNVRLVFIFFPLFFLTSFEGIRFICFVIVLSFLHIISLVYSTFFQKIRLVYTGFSIYHQVYIYCKTFDCLFIRFSPFHCLNERIEFCFNVII
jgi:hypothetical protein